MSGKVAVIIVNYNSGELLVRCLRSLAQQLVMPDLVVVVDNASSDDSLAGASLCGLNVRVVSLDDNLGFAAANNIALKQLDSFEYVALLNPDAFPDKEWLGALIDAAERNQDIDAFASRMFANDEHTILDGAGDAYHFTGLAWRVGHGASSIGKRYSEEREVFSPCAGAALYRRSVLSQLKGFDERFFCYMEDVDLGYRLRLAGGRCLYVPTATVVHIGSATTGKVSGFSSYYGHRNIVWVFLKNTPLSLLLLLLPFHLIMTVVLLPIMLSRGESRLYTRAKFDAVKGIPAVLVDRRKVQNLKTVGAFSILKLMNFSVFSRRE